MFMEVGEKRRKITDHSLESWFIRLLGVNETQSTLAPTPKLECLEPRYWEIVSLVNFCNEQNYFNFFFILEIRQMGFTEERRRRCFKRVLFLPDKYLSHTLKTENVCGLRVGGLGGYEARLEIHESRLQVRK
jgi:hypothetical protein